MTNPKRKGILSGVTRSALAAALTKIRPGDRVALKGNSGTVQGVNERMIAVGSDFGYRFTILAQELLMKPIEINGQRLQLTAIERKEEEPVELLTEYEVLDRQVDGVTEPVEPASEESDVHVPEGQDWRKYLTPEGYVRLKAAGWNDNRVMQACRIVSRPVLTAWKKEHGLDGLRLSTNGTVPLNDRFFQESLQRFGQVDEAGPSLVAEAVDEPARHRGNVTQAPAAEHNCTCAGTCGDQCRCTGESDIEMLADQGMDKIEQEWDKAQLQAEAEADTDGEDDFTWFGSEIRSRGAKDSFIGVSEKEIRISAAATVLAKFNAGDTVQVGVGSGRLAIRRSKRGIPLISRHARGAKSVQLSASALVRTLKEQGWPVPCNLAAEWDADRGMLVGYLDGKEVG